MKRYVVYACFVIMKLSIVYRKSVLWKMKYIFCVTLNTRELSPTLVVHKTSNHYTFLWSTYQG